MENSIGSRIKRAWNVFRNNEQSPYASAYGISNTYRPDRLRLTGGTEKSIINSVYNRISMDVAAIDIKHVKLDDDGRFIDTVTSGLNNCLNLEANIDQTGRAFIQDMVLTMLDTGSVAVVPVDTDTNPDNTQSYTIETMRVGEIKEWRPDSVKVWLYNDLTGRRQDVIVLKKNCAIIENPFYAIMNAPNSTMRRLVRKLNLLDAVDEQSSSGKLDLIIQLPYVIKSEARRRQAEDRRTEIENQLKGSKYGIAYTDGTERITQLNRPVENNLMSQIEYLDNKLYGQLGITQSVLDGTADEKTMLNYYTRTIEPILSAITGELKRKFLSKTARTQNHSIEFFRNPFKLVPVSELAEVADKMTRNEIMSSNEFRQVIGLKPSNQAGADELKNKNLKQEPLVDGNTYGELPPDWEDDEYYYRNGGY